MFNEIIATLSAINRVKLSPLPFVIRRQIKKADITIQRIEKLLGNNWVILRFSDFNRLGHFRYPGGGLN